MITDNTLPLIHQLLENNSHSRQNPDLSHFTKLLELLGNPHLHLPPIIHVAGTNGKGSVVAYLNRVLQLARYQVHTTTSPHLVHVTERIQISNQQISSAEFLTTLQEILTHVEGLNLTYFELITATAFTSFHRHPADFVLLETGLGGRYDATNVIEKPIITVITSISMDHKEILGTSLSDIAYEKAGIIKPNIPVITGPQYPEVEEVIKKGAEQNKAPLHIISPTIPFKLSLAGEHQQANAALADHVLRLLKIPEYIISEGLQTAIWPGRLQCVVYKDKEIWLDIAHNQDAVHAIVQYFRSQNLNRFDLIFSLKQNRDPVEFLEPFLPYAASITYIEQPNYAHCHSFEKIQFASKLLDVEIQKGKTPKQTIDQCKEKTILITGSSLIVGQSLGSLKT